MAPSAAPGPTRRAAAALATARARAGPAPVAVARLISAVPSPPVNYFYVTGALVVVWAIVVSFLGLSRPNFPGRFFPLVLAISALLFLGGIVGAALGSKHRSGERHGAPLPGKSE